MEGQVELIIVIVSSFFLLSLGINHAINIKNQNNDHFECDMNLKQFQCEYVRPYVPRSSVIRILILSQCMSMSIRMTDEPKVYSF